MIKIIFPGGGDSFVCQMKRGEAYVWVFYHRYVNVKQEKSCQSDSKLGFL